LQVKLGQKTAKWTTLDMRPIAGN